jgi:hypothetical protein
MPTTMTSKRLTFDDAKTFCEMMNIDSQVLHDTYNDPTKPIRIGIVRISFSPFSGPHHYTFTFIGG